MRSITMSMRWMACGFARAADDVKAIPVRNNSE